MNLKSGKIVKIVKIPTTCPQPASCPRTCTHGYPDYCRWEVVGGTPVRIMGFDPSPVGFPLEYISLQVIIKRIKKA